MEEIDSNIQKIVDKIFEKSVQINCIINEFKNGNNILREEKLLYSAIGNCFQSFGGEDLYKTPEEKAYILFLNIARNHPFVDGNKRTAAFITDYFLMSNDLELNIENEDKFKLMINLIEKNLDVDSGLIVFKSLVKPIESITRIHLNTETKKLFIGKLKQMEGFLENSNVEKDIQEVIMKNFMKNFASEHHVKYIELIDLINETLDIKEKDKNSIDLEMNNDR